MKKVIMTIAMMAMLAGFGNPAWAIDAAPGADKPLKIAVIDLQAILKESKAGKSIQDQLDKLRKNFQDEFSKQEEKLRGQDQELSKQRASLSAEEFTKRRREFEKNVAEAQRAAGEKRKQLEQAIGKATQDLQGRVFQIVGKISEDRNLTLVLSRNQVFLAQRTIDITKDTVAQLDAQVTSIPVALAPLSDSKMAAKPKIAN